MRPPDSTSTSAQPGQIAEQNEGLVKRIPGMVSPTPIRTGRHSSTQNVIKHQQMRIPKTFRGLGKIADEAWVVADLSLREDDSGAHLGLLKSLRPAGPWTNATPLFVQSGMESLS
jgi:hypothetical protein